MKKILQSITLLIAGMLIFSACTEEKAGKSPEQITEIIDVDPEELIKYTVSSDSITQEEPIIVPSPPMPPEPVPPGPMPDPEPWPDPMPWPNPIPEPPLPEPEPAPVPVQVDPILEFTDVEAIFPGGEKAMMKFISDNIKYPEVDKEMGTQGRVYVQFVVEKDGSLSNISIMRGVSKTIDREAKRVIRLMPKWKPAEAAGKIVRCRSRLPITFVLD
ncbi:MAG: energy transducer TonB [Crocinitomicaceae bacterium]|nr:energy transducer TonB [Flavobacteriales bacterium]NQZ37672.1 energy transducer TonB [Crocinitomicaceae bacterium]